MQCSLAAADCVTSIIAIPGLAIALAIGASIFIDGIAAGAGMSEVIGLDGRGQSDASATAGKEAAVIASPINILVVGFM